MSRDIEDGPDPRQGLVRRGFLGPPGGLPVLPLLVWVLLIGLIGLLLVGKGLPTAMDELGELLDAVSAHAKRDASGPVVPSGDELVTTVTTRGGLTGMFGAVVASCHAVSPGSSMWRPDDSGGTMTTDSIPSEPRRRLWRSRWAAVGAAVAVTFGAGGLFAVSAASPESSVVTLEPVRILDTRDPVNVGLDGPFVSPVAQDLKVTGSVSTTAGTKTVVPIGATGVFLNVTPVGSTAAGFISVRPANAAGLPSTSNVNFTTGATNPNAVLVELPVGGADDGKIEITFDASGVAGPTTDVLIDVVGYTSEARLADLDAKVLALEAATATLDAKVLALEAATATLDASQPFALASRSDIVSVNAATVVVAVAVVAPVNGQVTVMSSSSAAESDPGDDVVCSITTGNTVDPDYEQHFDSPGSTGQWESMAGTRLFDLAAGATGTYNLVCENRNAMTSNIFDSALSAIFTPAP